MMSFQIAVELDWEGNVPVASPIPQVEVALNARSPRATVRKLLRGGWAAGRKYHLLGRKLLDLKEGQGLAIRVRRLS